MAVRDKGHQSGRAEHGRTYPGLTEGAVLYAIHGYPLNELRFTRWCTCRCLYAPLEPNVTLAPGTLVYFQLQRLKHDLEPHGFTVPYGVNAINEV